MAGVASPRATRAGALDAASCAPFRCRRAPAERRARRCPGARPLEHRDLPSRSAHRPRRGRHGRRRRPLGVGPLRQGRHPVRRRHDLDGPRLRQHRRRRPRQAGHHRRRARRRGAGRRPPRGRRQKVVVRYGRKLDRHRRRRRRTSYWTTATTVAAAPAELGIRADSAKLSVSRSQPLGRQGLALSVTTPKDVTVRVDGKNPARPQHRPDRRPCSPSSKVTIGAKDRVSPALTTAVGKTASAITVARVKQKTVNVTQAVAFASRTHPGRRPVPRARPARSPPAHQGTRVVTYLETWVDGKLETARPRGTTSPSSRSPRSTADGTKAARSPRRPSSARPAAARPASVLRQRLVRRRPQPRRHAACGTGSPSASPAATGTSTPATATTAACSSPRHVAGQRRRRLRPARRPRLPRAADHRRRSATTPRPASARGAARTRPDRLATYHRLRPPNPLRFGGRCRVPPRLLGMNDEALQAQPSGTVPAGCRADPRDRRASGRAPDQAVGPELRRRRQHRHADRAAGRGRAERHRSSRSGPGLGSLTLALLPEVGARGRRRGRPDPRRSAAGHRRARLAPAYADRLTVVGADALHVRSAARPPADRPGGQPALQRLGAGRAQLPRGLPHAAAGARHGAARGRRAARRRPRQPRPTACPASRPPGTPTCGSRARSAAACSGRCRTSTPGWCSLVRRRAAADHRRVRARTCSPASTPRSPSGARPCGPRSRAGPAAPTRAEECAAGGRHRPPDAGRAAGHHRVRRPRRRGRRVIRASPRVAT